MENEKTPNPDSATLKKSSPIMNSILKASVITVNVLKDIRSNLKVKSTTNYNIPKTSLRGINSNSSNNQSNTNSSNQSSSKIDLGKAAGLTGLVGLLGVAGLAAFASFDGEKIAKNVKSLLSITDDYKLGALGFFVEGGTFGLAMSAIGAGLISFGVGQGIVNAVNLFSKDDWAEKVKSNVKTLLSIGDDNSLSNSSLILGGGALSIALGGIGAGLISFGAGQGLVNAVNLFSKDDWAEKVKSNVKTLLSINEDIKGISELGSFLGIMTSIGAGLAVFGVGAGVSNAISGLSDAYAKFTNEIDFASLIKNRVQTLLSINEDIKGVGDLGSFVGIMTSIATGLAVFGVGAGINNTISGFSDAYAKFTSGTADFASLIKNRVQTLISITDDLSDGDGPSSKAGKFAAGMSKIALGLAAFGAGSFVATLASVGEAIAKFFGANNPFDRILTLSDKADSLIQVGNALQKIAESLSSFGNIKFEGRRMAADLDDFIKEMIRVLPAIEALWTGDRATVERNRGRGTYQFIPPEGGLRAMTFIDEMSGRVSRINQMLNPERTNESNVGQLSRSISEVSNMSTRENTAAGNLLRADQNAPNPFGSLSPNIIVNNAPVTTIAPSTSNNNRITPIATSGSSIPVFSSMYDNANPWRAFMNSR
jgi:hypothetical protein